MTAGVHIGSRKNGSLNVSNKLSVYSLSGCLFEGLQQTEWNDQSFALAILQVRVIFLYCGGAEYEKLPQLTV